MDSHKYTRIRRPYQLQQNDQILVKCVLRLESITHLRSPL